MMFGFPSSKAALDAQYEILQRSAEQLKEHEQVLIARLKAIEAKEDYVRWVARNLGVIFDIIAQSPTLYYHLNQFFTERNEPIPVLRKRCALVVSST